MDCSNDADSEEGIDEEEFEPQGFQLLSASVANSIQKIVFSVSCTKIMKIVNMSAQVKEEQSLRLNKKVKSIYPKMQIKMNDILKADTDKVLKEHLLQTLCKADQIIPSLATGEHEAWRPPGITHEHMRSLEARSYMKRNEKLLKQADEQEAELLTLKQHILCRREHIKTTMKNVDRLKKEWKTLYLNEQSIFSD